MCSSPNRGTAKNLKEMLENIKADLKHCDIPKEYADHMIEIVDENFSDFLLNRLTVLEGRLRENGQPLVLLHDLIRRCQMTEEERKDVRAT